MTGTLLLRWVFKKLQTSCIAIWAAESVKNDPSSPVPRQVKATYKDLETYCPSLLRSGSKQGLHGLSGTPWFSMSPDRARQSGVVVSNPSLKLVPNLQQFARHFYSSHLVLMDRSYLLTILFDVFPEDCNTKHIHILNHLKRISKALWVRWRDHSWTGPKLLVTGPVYARGLSSIRCHVDHMMVRIPKSIWSSPLAKKLHRTRFFPTDCRSAVRSTTIKIFFKTNRRI